MGCVFAFETPFHLSLHHSLVRCSFTLSFCDVVSQFHSEKSLACQILFIVAVQRFSKLFPVAFLKATHAVEFFNCMVPPCPHAVFVFSSRLSKIVFDLLNVLA